MKKGSKLLTLFLCLIMAFTTIGSTAAVSYGASAKATSFRKKPSVTLTAGAERITVKWKPVKGAKGYQIYRATSKKGTYKRIKTIRKGSTLQYVNKKLKAGKKYYYKVRAYKKSGQKTKTGKFSSIKGRKALSRKEAAKKYVNKSTSALIAAIGKPKSSNYTQSCFGPGEDGIFYYKGFKVYTYRENGKEIVMSVE